MAVRWEGRTGRGQCLHLAEINSVTIVLSNFSHLTEKHVLTGCKHDMLGNQTFEVLHPLNKIKFVDTFLLNKYSKTLNPVFLCPRISEIRIFRWQLREQ